MTPGTHFYRKCCPNGLQNDAKVEPKCDPEGVFFQTGSICDPLTPVQSKHWFLHACMAHFLRLCPPVGLLKTLAKITTQIISQHVPNGSQMTSKMTDLFVIFLNFLINFGDCVQNAIVYPPGVIFETPNDDFDVNKHEFLSNIHEIWTLIHYRPWSSSRSGRLQDMMIRRRINKSLSLSLSIYIYIYIYTFATANVSVPEEMLFEWISETAFLHGGWEELINS